MSVYGVVTVASIMPVFTDWHIPAFQRDGPLLLCAPDSTFAVNVVKKKFEKTLVLL